MDMSKEFPSQTENRRQWILDTIRANQEIVCSVLLYLGDNPDMMRQAKKNLDQMHKQDRDAILQPGGILTDEQIEMLK